VAPAADPPDALSRPGVAVISLAQPLLSCMRMTRNIMRNKVPQLLFSHKIFMVFMPGHF
jgi:hypothetical protein